MSTSTSSLAEYGGVVDMEIHTDSQSPSKAQHAENINSVSDVGTHYSHGNAHQTLHGNNIAPIHTDIYNAMGGSIRTQQAQSQHGTQPSDVFRFGAQPNAPPVFVFGQNTSTPVKPSQAATNTNMNAKPVYSPGAAFGSDRTNTIPPTDRESHSGAKINIKPVSRSHVSTHTPQNTTNVRVGDGTAPINNANTTSNGVGGSVSEGFGLFGPTATTPARSHNSSGTRERVRPVSAKKHTHQPEYIIIDSDSDAGVGGQGSNVNTGLNAEYARRDTSAPSHTSGMNSRYGKPRVSGEGVRKSNANVNANANAYVDTRASGLSSPPELCVRTHALGSVYVSASKSQKNRDKVVPKAAVTECINLISSEEEELGNATFAQNKQTPPKGPHTLHTPARPQAKPSPRTQVHLHARAQKMHQQAQELQALERQEKLMREKQSERQQQQQQQQQKQAQQRTTNSHGPSYAHIPAPASAPRNEPRSPEHTDAEVPVPVLTPQTKSPRSALYSSSKKPRRSTSDTSEDAGMKHAQSGTNNGMHMELSQDGDVSTVTDMDEDVVATEAQKGARQSSGSANPQMHAHRSRRRPGHRGVSNNRKAQTHPSQPAQSPNQQPHGHTEHTRVHNAHTHVESGQTGRYQTQKHTTAPTPSAAGTSRTTSKSLTDGPRDRDSSQPLVEGEALAFNFATLSQGATVKFGASWPMKFGTTAASPAAYAEPNATDTPRFNATKEHNAGNGQAGVGNDASEAGKSSGSFGVVNAGLPSGVFRFGASEPSPGAFSGANTQTRGVSEHLPSKKGAPVQGNTDVPQSPSAHTRGVGTGPFGNSSESQDKNARAGQRTPLGGGVNSGASTPHTATPASFGVEGAFERAETGTAFSGKEYSAHDARAAMPAHTPAQAQQCMQGETNRFGRDDFVLNGETQAHAEPHTRTSTDTHMDSAHTHMCSTQARTQPTLPTVPAEGSSVPDRDSEADVMDVHCTSNTNASCLDGLEKLSVADSSVSGAEESTMGMENDNSSRHMQSALDLQEKEGNTAESGSTSQSGLLLSSVHGQQEPAHTHGLAQPDNASASSLSVFSHGYGASPRNRTHTHRKHKHVRHQYWRMLQKRDDMMEKCPYVTEKRALGRTQFMAQDYQGAIVAYSEAIEHIEMEDPSMAADTDELSVFAGAADRCPYHQLVEDTVSGFDFGFPSQPDSAQIGHKPSFAFVADSAREAIVFGQQAQGAGSMPEALTFNQHPQHDTLTPDASMPEALTLNQHPQHDSAVPDSSMPEALTFNQHAQADKTIPEALATGRKLPDTNSATNAHTYHSGTSNSTGNDLGAGDSGKAEVMLECAESMDTISEEVVSSATDMTYTGDTLRDMNLASEAGTPPNTGRDSGLKLVDSSRETVRDMETTGDRINTTATTTHAKLVKTASVGNKEESVGAAKVELALLYTNRGLCHSKLAAYNRAHKDWYRAIEINESDLKPLVSLTKLQIRLGELRIAKTLCTDGLALCEKYPTERNQSFQMDLASCHILLARLQQAHKAVSSWCAETFEINLTGNDGDGDSAQALNTVESDIVLLKQHCPESVLYKLYHVRCLGHGMGKYDQAVELIEELVMSHPGNLGVYTEAANCYLESVEFENCENIISAAFNGLNKQADNDKDAFTGHKQSQLTQQMKATKKLMNRMRAARKNGNTKYNAKEYRFAIKLYSDALDIAPNNKRYCALIHNNMAAAFRAIGDLTGAMRHVQTSLTYHPKYLPALRREITVMMETGKTRETIVKLEGLLNDFPEDQLFVKQLEIAQKKLAKQGQAAADALRLRLEKQSHYEAMGLVHTATSSDIKKAYRKLVLQHHPDKTQTDDEIVKAESDTKFKRVQAAYEVLKDEALRRRYDLTLRVQPTYMRPSYSASSSRDYYTPDFSNPPPRPRQTPFEAARGKGRNGKGRSRRAPHF